MHKLASLMVFCTLCLVLSLVASAAPITIPTVPVGNVGNANDPSNFNLYGSVNYVYNIGTTEVTNDQYAAFLNAKAQSDPLALYNVNSAGSVQGGIARSGVSGSFTYTVNPNMGDKPVNYVTWYDTIRFANWLNNGQGNGDTETGAYTLLGGTPTPSNGNSITRNAGATWALTSENEWYKAAYYDPRTTAQGGPPADSHYWSYATQSNTVPTKATANAVGDVSNPGANVVNYGDGANWNGQNGNVTTVGSAGPLSFYGTSDQDGNLAEWDESLVNFSSRVVRGGSYFSDSTSLLSSTRQFGDPAGQFLILFGFRVVNIPVPEPNSVILAAFGIVSLAVYGWRRKRT